MPNEVMIFSAPVVEDQKGGPKLLGDSRKVSATTVSVETIRLNLSNFVGSLDQIIPDLKPREDGFKLDSFDVAVGVNGKGEVGFLGTGVEIGATATLTLKFSRR